MWAACDLSNYIIYTKMGVNPTELAVNNNVFSVPIELPSLYYKPVPPNTKGFPNTEIYIPEDTYNHSSVVTPLTNMHIKYSNALKATTSAEVAEKRPANKMISPPTTNITNLKDAQVYL